VIYSIEYRNGDCRFLMSEKRGWSKAVGIVTRLQAEQSGI